jgi:hypothetical protein
MQTLGWGSRAKCFAWSAVESLGDVLEVLGPVDAQVGASGEVYAQLRVAHPGSMSYGDVQPNVAGSGTASDARLRRIERIAEAI